MKTLLCRSLVAILAILLSAPGRWLPNTIHAAECITNFHSDIALADDGLMTVTETISVNAEGKKIKRGIYRDIPVRYDMGFYGLKQNIPFKIGTIDCDGIESPYREENRGIFKRIYIGSKNVELPAGPHTYTIRYTTRQLRFLNTHDEVYWNVTGNAWTFPIEKAEATITFPKGINITNVSAEGYAGSLGSTNQDDITISIDNEKRQVTYKTKHFLKPQEGLTVVATIPSGFFVKSTTTQVLFGDPFLRWGCIGLLCVIGYFSTAWWIVGRDPATGAIVPLYEPPDNLSPAGCRFISQMGYDKECFSVALLSLATQQALVIHQNDQTYTLAKQGKPADSASDGEKQIFDCLFNDRESLTIKRDHHQIFSSAMNTLKKSLVREFEGSLFRPNRIWFFGGVLLSLTVFALVIFVAAGTPATGATGFLALWLAGWSFGVVMLLHKVISAWRIAIVGNAGISSIATYGSAIFFTLFSLPFIFGELIAMGILAWLTSLWIIPLILGIVTTVAVFYELIKAPTAAGRKIMDQIDGFSMYLSTAEQDRLEALTRQATNKQQRHAAPRTIELFERFLPYAVALNVANKWAEQFQDLITAASEPTKTDETSGYQPRWYHGSAWNTSSLGATAAGLGSAMTAAVAAAATSPSSSSGSSGGGFSGGGGGGGGGGGW